MILHVPHAAKEIPEQFRDQFVLTDAELDRELLIMTDAGTDELFALPQTTMVRFPWSRLLVDVERFPDDRQEPLSAVGMGMIYTRTAAGHPLRRPLRDDERTRLKTGYYEPHHQALLAAVTRELLQQGTALLIDCHSFPSQPLPFEQDQATPRPDFCIGTDAWHTPRELALALRLFISKRGFRVGINRPYAGAIVPLHCYRCDRRVTAIMVEVNRKLYLDEATGRKTGQFPEITAQLQAILQFIGQFRAQSRQDS